MTKKTKEEDLMDLLDIIILLIMLVEKIESFQVENHYNRQQVKQASKRLLDIITPIAERDYKIVFNNGEEQIQQVISEYENFVAQIRDFNVPQKVMLTQIIQAFNLDKDVIEGTIHRVIKKHSK
jgi:hypothetical protein